MSGKTVSRFLFVLIAVASLLVSFSPAGAAQTGDSGDQVTFAMLGYADQTIRGPYDSMRVRFSIPPTWRLQSGAILHLKMNGWFTSIAVTPEPNDVNVGAILQVTLNNVVLENIFPVNGSQTYDIPVPDEALVTKRADGRHELKLTLDSARDCFYDHQSAVVVLADSALNFPHEQVEPTLDLAQLPSPIYQESSFMPEPAVIVVNDQPSVAELKAALTVASSLGRMTNGGIPLQLIPAGQLTEEIKASSHVIAVGKPGGLDFLSEAEFPTDLSGGAIQDPAAQPDDGFLQMALSPWNPVSSLLYVGGNSDAGVIKAAQALSSGVVRPGPQPTLAVVSDVSAAVQLPAVAEDRTLESLGYEAQTVSGVTSTTFEFDFFVPPGQVAGPNPYFELLYSHSALIDFTRSGIIVLLNGQSIGSVQFNEQTAKQVNVVQIPMPDYVIRPGNNRLAVQADLLPMNNCSSPSNSGLWMTIDSASLIHLPLVPVAAGKSATPQDLSAYPYPFIGNPGLAETAVVLPRQDAESWDIAARLMAALGRRATSVLITPEVVFADEASEEIRQNYDLLVIGRATQVPLLVDLSQWLPAPFSAGSDVANESGLAVTYRVAEGVDLGYLEFLPSPWNSQRAIVVVSGSTPGGLRWAGNALLDPQLSAQLGGNYAVLNGAQVATSDTRQGLGITGNISATAVPGENQVAEPVAIVQPGPLSEPRPGWILPATIFVTFLILIVLLVAVMNNSRQNKSPMTREARR